MSYSGKVKAEIIYNSSAISREEFLALLSAVMKVSGTMSILPKGQVGFHISTENPGTARFLTRHLKRFIDSKVQVRISRGTTLKKKNLYIISLDKADQVRELLFQTGVLRGEGDHLVIDEGVPKALINSDALVRAYLKGAFLGSGSMANPEKQYHLEFVTHSENYANALVTILAGFQLKGRVISRKGSHVVYFKEGDQIVDLLNIMGAHQALLETENIRIVKGMRNDVNRLVNCETANLDKTVNASVRQMEAIRHIQRTIGLSRLPENLRQVAELRVAYPDASLKEMGEMLEPKLGKSGINHRLRRLEAIAEEIDKEG